MGRSRKFSDSLFKKRWMEYSGDVKAIAKHFDVSLVTIYKYSGRAGLKTKIQCKIGEVQPGDKRLVEWFTLHRSADDLADRLIEIKSHARYTVTIAAQRLWTNGYAPNFPKPRTPTEIQVYNLMRKLDGKVDSYGGNKVDDIDLIIERFSGKVKDTSIILRYFERYQGHQETLGAKKTKRAKGGRRTKSAKAGSTKKKKVVKKKKSSHRGRRSKSR